MSKEEEEEKPGNRVIEIDLKNNKYIDSKFILSTSAYGGSSIHNLPGKGNFMFCLFSGGKVFECDCFHLNVSLDDDISSKEEKEEAKITINKIELINSTLINSENVHGIDLTNYPEKNGWFIFRYFKNSPHAVGAVDAKIHCQVVQLDEKGTVIRQDSFLAPRTNMNYKQIAVFHRRNYLSGDKSERRTVR